MKPAQDEAGRLEPVFCSLRLLPAGQQLQYSPSSLIGRNKCRMVSSLFAGIPFSSSNGHCKPAVAARFGLSGIVAARHAETSPDLTRAHRCAARRSSVLQNPGTLPCGHGSLRNGALLGAKADRVGA